MGFTARQGASDLDVLTTHSFVVRIWLEESVDEGGRAHWRGHITHVPDGARRYFEHLGDIARFVEPYLADMGVDLGVRGRVAQWLRRL